MILATCITILSALMTVAQVRDPAQATPVVAPGQPARLSVQAAAPPALPLKYLLLPEFGQQIPGNAAPEYLIALELFPPADKVQEIYDLVDAPQFDKEAARRLLAGSDNRFDMLRLASQREDCNWSLPLREQGINTLLPHLSHIMSAARALALRARLQMADGKFDDAVDSLRIGFAIAQHLRSQAGLVQGLVANGIHRLMLERIIEMQQMPGAPNLYWALANLPRPLLDFPGMVGVERSWLWASFPELRGRRPEQLNVYELSDLFRRMNELQQSINSSRPPDFMSTFTFAISMVGPYERAKQQLIDQGRSADEVQKMPVQAVLAPYLLNDYSRWNDEMFKWAGLPYWQARAGLANSTQQLQNQRSLLTNPLMVFTASLNRSMLQIAETERLAARVQLTEALRAFAAAHDGKLPPTLDAITETPVPSDPMTGKPFDYSVSNNVATLRLAGFEPSKPQSIQISIK